MKNTTKMKTMNALINVVYAASNILAAAGLAMAFAMSAAEDAPMVVLLKAMCVALVMMGQWVLLHNVLGNMAQNSRKAVKEAVHQDRVAARAIRKRQEAAALAMADMPSLVTDFEMNCGKQGKDAVLVADKVIPCTESSISAWCMDKGYPFICTYAGDIWLRTETCWGTVKKNEEGKMQLFLVSPTVSENV